MHNRVINILKIIIDTIIFLFIIFGTIFQGFSILLLGSDIPVNVSKEEFYSFIKFAIVWYLITIIYIKIKTIHISKSSMKTTLILIFTIAFLALCLIELFDTFIYHRHILLDIITYISFGISGSISLYLGIKLLPILKKK